ncbi:aldo/keto reductase [Gemmatimonadota bacterium]
MDFKERVPFGGTGVMVSRIGLASGFGVPSAAIEKAFHEYGINYFYLSPLLNTGKMVQAIRNLAPGHRDEFCIVLAKPTWLGPLGVTYAGSSLQRFVERWLKKFKIEWADLLIQDVRKPPSPKLGDLVQRLKESGKVRLMGMSSHSRPLFGEIARGEAQAPVDFFHIRYNAVHTGAEEDIFPHLPQENRPGIGIYTATCWRKLLKPKLMPAGEVPLSAADCYRFVLSHPDVDVCLTAPSTAERMEENLKALDAGPLNDEEMARARRIGKHIYGK